MKLSSIKINADAAENGAWIDNIPDLGGLRLKVRGQSNSDFRKMQTKLVESVPRQKRQRGKVDPELMDDILAKCYAHTIILDWDGLTDDDDVPIPFSKEKALELLTDKSLRVFRDGVSYASAVVSDLDADNVDAASGNSEAS